MHSSVLSTVHDVVAYLPNSLTGGRKSRIFEEHREVGQHESDRH